MKIKEDFELKPLQVWRNTWWHGLKKGYVILLSCEPAGTPNDRGWLWTIAFSYFGDGCQIMQWYEYEIKKCEYLGYLPELLKKYET